MQDFDPGKRPMGLLNSARGRISAGLLTWFYVSVFSGPGPVESFF